MSDGGSSPLVHLHVQNLELMEAWSERDPSMRGRFTFPIHADVGAASSSAIYFTHQAGQHTSAHTHTAEELVLVLEGEAEVMVDGQTCRVGAGGLVLVPSGASHDVRNVGAGTLRAVGFFPAAATLTRFDEVWLPMQTRVFVVPRPAP